ncbi:MAG TPA: hypothetical protein PLZ51_28920, partial [Aggregatilineales bacterium]|nr:hypothetical protein [Aggregatilineales bacterium]
IYSVNQLQRYTFATDSLDVLLENTTYIARGLLSPDSQRFAFNDGTDSNTYILHLPTATQYNVSIRDEDGNLLVVARVFW